MIENEELFNGLCAVNRHTLDNLQRCIDDEGVSRIWGTLETIGVKYSYDLACVAMAYGYAGFHFRIDGSFEEVKEYVINCILDCEQHKDKSNKEVQVIKDTLVKARPNKAKSLLWL